MGPLRQFSAANYISYLASNQPHKAALKLLQRILVKSYRTDFGRLHGLRPTMSVDEFRRAVPIHTYDDYQHWIEQIIAGNNDVLWPGRPMFFATTSGTTARNKTVPITHDFIDDYHVGTIASFRSMLLHTPRAVLGRILTLGGPSRESWLGDVPVGSITGILYETLPHFMHARLVVPPFVHNIPSQDEKLYIIARLALEARISGIITMVPGALITLSNLINQSAESLISEIAHGTVRPLFSCSNDDRRMLLAHIRPNASRAKFLKGKLNAVGKLRPSDIWPIRGICAYVKLGSQAQWNRIMDDYAKPTIIDPGLVATEGRVSVGLFPDAPYHAAIPVSSFLELLPVDDQLSAIDAQQAILPCEATPGNRYCPIISSANGLMRYRLDDVITVTGYAGRMPLIEYLGRLDDSLSLAGEKVCEAHFRAAVESIRQDGFLVDGAWALATDTSAEQPRYHFFWETADSSSFLIEQLDRALQIVNVSYRRKREQSLILPMRGSAVAFGELTNLQERARWVGQSKSRILYDRSTPVVRTM